MTRYNEAYEYACDRMADGFAELVALPRGINAKTFAGFVLGYDRRDRLHCPTPRTFGDKPLSDLWSDFQAAMKS